MVQRPHLATLLTAFVLIAAGLFSFFANPERPMTALIAPVLGILLLVMVPGVKSGNKVVAHIVVVLTLIFAIMTTSMALKIDPKFTAEVQQRRTIVFGMMAVVCYLATLVYVLGFIQKRKERKQQAGTV